MAWSRRRRALVWGSAAWLAVCATGELLSSEPSLPPSGHSVSLVSAPIPAIGTIARHSWLVVRADGESHWERWDLYATSGGGPFDHVARAAVDAHDALHYLGERGTIEWVIQGQDAVPLIACIRSDAPRYPARDRYRAWPGPNSNSFIDSLLRSCDVDLPMSPTAIGKDWRGWVGASVTRQSTGVQLETPVIGIAIGLREGLELHPLGLTLGVDPWPPATLLPVGHGRFGFDP